jgi:hypothetical protein
MSRRSAPAAAMGPARQVRRRDPAEARSLAAGRTGRTPGEARQAAVPRPAGPLSARPLPAGRWAPAGRATLARSAGVRSAGVRSAAAGRLAARWTGPTATASRSRARAAAGTWAARESHWARAKGAATPTPAEAAGGSRAALGWAREEQADGAALAHRAPADRLAGTSHPARTTPRRRRPAGRIPRRTSLLAAQDVRMPSPRNR